jgi:hypothetical protein
LVTIINVGRPVGYPVETTGRTLVSVTGEQVTDRISERKRSTLG